MLNNVIEKIVNMKYKRIIGAILIIITILIVINIINLIIFSKDLASVSNGNITYIYGDINVKESLTKEEIQILKKILKNKKRHFEPFHGHAGGFNKNVFFKLDNMKFYITCDNCGILKYNNRYIYINDEEREEINKIFDKYAGWHMCI